MLKKRRVRKRIILKKCLFCKDKTFPDYKDYETLKGFLAERGKILNQNKTGVCAKHQRRLSCQMKRARHLGLLPFVVKPLQ